MEDVKVNELEEICKKAFDLKEEIDGEALELKKKRSELEELKAKLENYLEAIEKTTYHSNFGNVTAARRMSVSFPKEPEAKAQFLNYLKEQGVYDDMISVNSQSLNSYFRQEMENAAETGHYNFIMPGIGEPRHSIDIRLNKKKGK